MADQVNTKDQLNKLFQSVTAAALGIDEQLWIEYEAADPEEWTYPVPDNPYNKVRIAWQTDGQPGWEVDDDVVVISLTETDSDYNALREHEYRDNDEPLLSLDDTVKYTRYWAARWVCYGPNSFENARKIKSAMYKQVYRNTLAQSHMYLVPDNQAPRRVPERYAQRWYERVDLIMYFNEAVSETESIPAIGTAGFKLYVDNGTERDFAASADLGG